MKKIVTISLGMFVLFLVVIFSMWFGVNQNKNSTNQNTVQSQSQENIQLVSNLTLDMQEITKHNTPKDCWTVVRGKVYDVTNFASKHPGGEGAILYNCGKDGTVGFDTKGGNGSHEEESIDILSKYLLGDLVTYQGK